MAVSLEVQNVFRWFNHKYPFVGRCLFFFVSLALLVGCGAGQQDLDLPPSRPAGLIEGQVMAGQYNGGIISAYTFNALDQREFLGKTIISATGEFELSLLAASQVILLEVNSGKYTEVASGIEVVTDNGSGMTAIFNYDSGEHSLVYISPLSHLMTGLGLYLLSQQQSSESAFQQANEMVTNVFGFDVVKTRPGTEIDIQETQLGDSNVLYALLLQGLSYLTLEFSQSSESNPHELLNVWTLSQLLFNDVQSDGLLDGKQIDPETQEASQLYFGQTAVNAEFLQTGLARAMLETTLYTIARDNLDQLTLQNSILDFSTRVSPLVPDSVSLQLQTSPQISLKQALPNFLNGDVQFAVEVSGILKLANVTYFIDGTPFAGLDDSPQISKKIDSRQFSDGEHLLKVVAEDTFANKGSVEYTIKLDNTSPAIEVSGKIATNQNLYRLKGLYAESGSGIAAIKVNDQEAILAEDGSWYVDLALSPGQNSFTLEVKDQLNNQLQQALDIDLDQSAPEIESSDPHSAARFVAMDGQFFDAGLQDANNLPVYLESRNLELSGRAVSRTELDKVKIPYFYFIATDPVVDGVASTGTALKVEMRVKKNGEYVSDWKTLASQNEEFIIPLVNEFLGNSLDDALLSDAFDIEVRAEDAAMNLAKQTFSFKAAIMPGNPNMNIVGSFNTDVWQSADFSHRDALINKTLPVVEYTLLNDSSSPYYLQLNELKENTIIQVFDEVSRQNKVRLQTLPRWRIGKVTNPTTQCPQFLGEWQIVDSIQNYVGKDQFGNDQWEKRQPQASFAAPEIVLPPNPESPPASDWHPLADFDDIYFSDGKTEFGQTLSYQYDYITDLSIAGSSQPALVQNWKLTTANDKSVVTCEDMRNIEYQETYQYQQEPDYPKNLKYQVNLIRNFNATHYRVLDEDGSEIQATDGWFLIPASHRVTIQKYINTQNSGIFEDLEVTTPDVITDYQPYRFDKNISWRVSQSLQVKLAQNLQNMLESDVLHVDYELSANPQEFSLSRD